MFIQTSAGSKGSADAQYRLGLMYIDGRGVEKYPYAANSFLIKAAQQGHQKAKELLLERGAISKLDKKIKVKGKK